MKKLLALSKRNLKEIIRDPLATVFCMAFPIIMLVVMQILFNNINLPVPEQFQIKNYAVGICVFGYTFVTMFTAMKIAGDKNTAFIKRINILPIKRSTYILSFFVSALPVVAVQTLLFFILALPFGLELNATLLLAFVYLIPSMVLYITEGVLIGVLCKSEDKTGPLCSILVTLTALLGGVFMPLNMFTGSFKTVVELLPFCHSTQIASELYTVGASCIYPHILYLLGYIIVLWLIIWAICKKRQSL